MIFLVIFPLFTYTYSKIVQCFIQKGGIIHEHQSYDPAF